MGHSPSRLLFFLFTPRRPLDKGPPGGGVLGAQAHVWPKLAKMTTRVGFLVVWGVRGPKGPEFFFIRFGSGENFFGAWVGQIPPPPPPGGGGGATQAEGIRCFAFHLNVYQGFTKKKVGNPFFPFQALTPRTRSTSRKWCSGIRSLVKCAKSDQSPILK